MKVLSYILKFKLVIMNDGVMRVGGRILRVFILFNVMNLMILFKDYYVLRILICYLYERNGYCGIE